MYANGSCNSRVMWWCEVFGFMGVRYSGSWACGVGHTGLRLEGGTGLRDGVWPHKISVSSSLLISHWLDEKKYNYVRRRGSNYVRSSTARKTSRGNSSLFLPQFGGVLKLLPPHPFEKGRRTQRNLKSTETETAEKGMRAGVQAYCGAIHRASHAWFKVWVLWGERARHYRRF